MTSTYEEVVEKLRMLKVQELELDYALTHNEKEQEQLELKKIRIEPLSREENKTFRAILSYVAAEISTASNVLMNLLYEEPDDELTDIYSCRFYSITMDSTRVVVDSVVQDRHRIFIKTLNENVEKIVQSFFQQDMEDRTAGFIRRVWFQSPKDGHISCERVALTAETISS
jgi:hypothetical protein